MPVRRCSRFGDDLGGDLERVEGKKNRSSSIRTSLDLEPLIECLYSASDGKSSKERLQKRCQSDKKGRDPKRAP